MSRLRHKVRFVECEDERRQKDKKVPNALMFFKYSKFSSKMNKISNDILAGIEIKRPKSDRERRS